MVVDNIKYDDMKSYSKDLSDSTALIREIISKYSTTDFSRIVEFCDTIESYSRYLSSSVQLLEDSDKALVTIINKNKKNK